MLLSHGSDRAHTHTLSHHLASSSSLWLDAQPRRLRRDDLGNQLLQSTTRRLPVQVLPGPAGVTFGVPAPRRSDGAAFLARFFNCQLLQAGLGREALLDKFVGDPYVPSQLSSPSLTHPYFEVSVDCYRQGGR